MAQNNNLDTSRGSCRDSENSSLNSKLIKSLDNFSLSSCSSDGSDISSEFKQASLGGQKKSDQSASAANCASSTSSATSVPLGPTNSVELEQYIRSNLLLEEVLNSKKLSLTQSTGVMNFLRESLKQPVIGSKK